MAMLEFNLIKRPRIGLATKILLPALAISLAVAAGIYIFFSAKLARQAEADLRNRLEHFISSQAAELAGPVWEFDQETIERLFRGYAQNSDLQWIRLYDANGGLLAQAGEGAAETGRVFTAERLLSRRASGESLAIGRLEAAFHDARIRQTVASGRLIDLPAAAVLLFFLACALGLAVNWQIGKPLRLLRESLERNAASGLREPLPWTSRDELGQVVEAYNTLLAEINQHTEKLEKTNADLLAEIAQRLQVEKRLLLFKTVVEATDAAVVITDRHFTVLEINAACQRITGFTADQILGRSIRASFLSAHDGKEHQAIVDSIARQTSWSGELWGFSRSGKPLPLRATINALTHDGGAISYHVLVFSDITKLKATERLLKNLAYSDSLTGLPNRALFMDRLEQEISIDSRRARGFTLMFIDIDQFKNINDSLGHSAGDQVLEDLAKRMRQCLREEDTLARMGGDEFTVIVRETVEVEVVQRLAEKLISHIALPLELDGVVLEIGASIGMALFPQDGPDSDALMKNADTAMYSAKAEGGGKARFFEPDIAAKAKAQFDLKSKLKRAISENEFVLHYQPIVDMGSGTTVHHEALIRWNHHGSLVYPNDFIFFAEEAGLITQIGRLALDMAFAQMRDWSGDGIPLRLSINVSRNQFQDEDFLDDLIERAEKCGIDPGMVVLEITESMIIADPVVAKVIIGRLISSGFRIAVDDFGVGYSSLSVLVEYPVHIVKLDRSLIKTLEHDSRARSMISGFIELFQRLGLEVVAEGVETAMQHEFLSVAGCDFAQGWLYGKPMPAHAALKSARSKENRFSARLAQDVLANPLKQ
ncbi:MAG: EAL domain-containing protein [Desulfovibrionaceae bacterium]|nr:EAL domain-containing protein [Desulfovibrionaceae bacterium]MBF0512443.1 EAL domain-containing protein [Desulfovibrionaceae bacterium]